MAIHVFVFCRSARPLAYTELAEIAFMGFLDDTPTLEPPLESPAANDPDWPFLTMYYRPDRRPVQVERCTKPEEWRPTLEEIYEEMKRTGVWERHQDLVQFLEATQQAYFFELGSQLPDDVWDMLAVAEAFLARELDGVIYAEEGFYDAELRVIFSLKS